MTDSHSDLKSLFLHFLAAFRSLPSDSQSFKIIEKFLLDLGYELSRHDPKNTEIFLESIVLPELCKLAKVFPNKREFCAKIIYAYSQKNVYCTLTLINRQMELLQNDLATQYSLLAHIISLGYLNEEKDFNTVLSDHYAHAAYIAISSCSPFLRTCGFKIMQELSKMNPIYMTSNISKLAEYTKDPWWEVQAQILIICVNLLIFLNSGVEKPDEISNQEEVYSQEENPQEEDENKEEQGSPAEEQNQKKGSQSNGKEQNSKESIPEQAEKSHGSLREEDLSSSSDEEGIPKTRTNMSIGNDGKNQEEFLRDRARVEVKEANEPEDEVPLEEDEDEKYSPEEMEELRLEHTRKLMEMLREIFQPSKATSILKIGLIYIAQILRPYPELCDLYLTVLLSVSKEVRMAAMEITPPPEGEEGQLVLGSSTFKYRLYGAPMEWNSIGVASSLKRLIKEKGVSFRQEHIDILASCLVQEMKMDEGQWWEIFKELKDELFYSLCEEGFCRNAAGILKKMISNPVIQAQALNESRDIFQKIFERIYSYEISSEAKMNLLDMLQSLCDMGEVYKEYCYSIIKNFSGKTRKKYLESNLIDFMNNLARTRRGIPPFKLLFSILVLESRKRIREGR